MKGNGLRAISVIAVLLPFTSAVIAQAPNEGRDWYVEQKRIQKEARIAAASRDAGGLYGAEGLNMKHRHKLREPWGVQDGPCETYQLRVYRMIADARAGQDWRKADQVATAAGDACWADLVKRR